MSANMIAIENPYIGADEPEDLEFESDSLESNEVIADVTPETEVEEVQPAAEAEPEEASDSAEESAEADSDEVEAKVEEPEVEETVEAEVEETVEAVVEKPTIQVPKSRLDAEVAKRRELEARIREIEQGQKPEADQIEFKEIDPKLMFDKVLDGDIDGAGQVFMETMKQIAQTTANSVTEKLTPQIQSAPQVTQTQIAMNQAADEISARYDVLNPQTEAFSETLQNEVIDLRDMYISRGFEPVGALQKATNMVMAGEGIQPKSLAPVPEKKAPVKKQPSLEQKLQAAESQPPETSNSQAAEPEPAFDVMSMTDADLDKLSEAQLSRLRGDFI